MLPKYIFIGPHKSGTTWIDHYLRYRGDVVLPELTKETFYFDKLYERGAEWYAAQFAVATPQHRFCVEVAPSLLDKPEAARRVARDLPDVTVICTLRNPVDRGVAHYFHHLKGGERDMGFKAMARKHPELLSNGMYTKHLTMWRDLLGADRVKVLRYDLLTQDAQAYVHAIDALLGLPENMPPAKVLAERVNEDGDPPLRWLAKAGRRTAETLRVLGAHQLVNRIRTKGVRRVIYGPPPEQARRARVHGEAMEFYDLFHADFSKLHESFDVDLADWVVPAAQRSRAFGKAAE